MLIRWQSLLRTLVSRFLNRSKLSGQLYCQQLSPLEASLAASIPDLLILMNRQGDYRALNRGEGIKLLNPERVVPTGGNVFAVLPPDKAEERLFYVKRALETGQMQQYEYSLSVEGEIRYEEARLSICGQDMVLIIVRDITEKKRAEELMQLRAQQEAILNHISQHIRQSLRLEEVLHTAVAEIREWLKADRLILYRLNGDLEGDIVVESVRDPDLSILAMTVRDPCLGEFEVERFRQGRIRVHEDIQAEDLPDCYVDLLNQF